MAVINDNATVPVAIQPACRSFRMRNVFSKKPTSGKAGMRAMIHVNWDIYVPRWQKP
jgi:hypothetical protein